MENEENIVEVVEVEKKSFKEKVKEFCKNHPDVVLTLTGGIASIIGGCLKLYANKSDYDDYLYTSLDDGEVYKLPAKQMKSAKRFRKNKKDK